MNQKNSRTAIYTSNIQNKTKPDYPFFRSSATHGIIAGGLIALSLFILQVLGMGDVIGWKYAIYGILAIILAEAIGDYDRFLETGTTFRKGMLFAAQISLFTGIVLIGINTIAFLADTNLVFSKYGKEAIDFPTLLTINGAIFLEIMVAGLIFTLVVLQYFKSRKDYKE